MLKIVWIFHELLRQDTYLLQNEFIYIIPAAWFSSRILKTEVILIKSLGASHY